MRIVRGVRATQAGSGAARLGAFWIALTLGLAGDPASATGVPSVDLLQFPMGGRNTGFTNAGPDFDAALVPESEFLCAGAAPFNPSGVCAGMDGYQLTITQKLDTVWDNPQARGQNPSPSSPFVADSKWKIKNDTSTSFTDPILLLFTSVALDPYPGAIATSGYPDLQVGMDGNLLSIARYTAMGTHYYFGAVNVGRLAPGESASFTVRYVVSSGPMPIVDSNVVMPPLKVVAALVPEPGTLALLGLGIAVLAARRR